MLPSPPLSSGLNKMWSLFAQLTSPKKFFFLSGRLLPWLTLFFILTLAYGLIGGLFLAPPDYLQGDGFRIIYVHAPCAFLSLFIYFVMAVSAVLVLAFRINLAAIAIKHSISLGAGFAFLALVTGSLWGKPMWGTWWIWDARLTSELILLFLYLGLLLFQSATAQKWQSNKAISILVLVGFVDIPIIHYSVYWWNTLHQGNTLTLFKKPTIAAPMLYPLLAMITAFFLYYFIVLAIRMRHELVVLQARSHWLMSQ